MKSIVNTVFKLSFIIYVTTLISVLFLGGRVTGHDMSLSEYIGYLKNNVNIVPFRTISIYVEAILTGSMNLSIPIRNLVGNLILFLPMGIYLPSMAFRMNRLKVYFSFVAIALFFIEVMQLVTRRGIFDIDDFILNVSGALVGFIIFKSKPIQRMFVWN